MNGPPTGWVFKIYDPDADGVWAKPSGQYLSRHDAVGASAVFGRRFDFDFEITAHESLYREVDEPVVCDNCDHEEYHRPLIQWTFPIDTDAGPFCSTHCFARWAWSNDPRYITDGGDDGE